MKLAIFGAKSIALGICLAVQKLYPEHEVEAFLVSSLEDNPSVLAGLPVREIQNFSNKEVCVLIATPEDLHTEIMDFLESQGFSKYVCMDAYKEMGLMEKYFDSKGIFPSVHKLPRGHEAAILQIYQAKFHRDKPLKRTYAKADWVVPMQVGAALTTDRVAKEVDCTGDHISGKNVNYCELTALYWMWKNRLEKNGYSNSAEIEYYGLFHYRRILDIQSEDLSRIKENDVDVILPYPMLHEPDIYEHHTRYVKENDWEAMLQALEELHPSYAEAFWGILRQPYLYNYNIIIAKRRVLEQYCQWLFPILERTEALSEPKGWERQDRYIGYLGENLMTLYFLYHQKDLKIYHTGRRMLT